MNFHCHCENYAGDEGEKIIAGKRGKKDSKRERKREGWVRSLGGSDHRADHESWIMEVLCGWGGSKAVFFTMVITIINDTCIENRVP